MLFFRCHSDQRQPSFRPAKYFVEHFDFNWYTYLDDNAQTKQMTIAKICDILTWQNQQLGFQDQDGFKVPVNMKEELQGQSMTISK